MTAYNFDRKFGYLVTDGLKRQTVRKPRKRSVNIGDTLQLYTGMRTKRCEKLMDVTCTGELRVMIGQGEVEFGVRKLSDGLELCARKLPYDELREFAWRDGFMYVDDMFAFFDGRYRLPVLMELISWDIPTMDRVVYGGINVTYDLEVRHEMQFVDALVAGGQRLWRAPSGRVVSVAPWDWDKWCYAGVQMIPWYVFTGIPVGWEPYRS